MDDIVSEIDARLLVFFGKISHVTYVWCGITNFHWAKVFIITNLLSNIIFYGNKFYFEKAFLEVFTLVFFWLGFSFQYWKIVSRRQKTCKPGIKNPGQIFFLESLVRVVSVNTSILKVLFWPRDFLGSRNMYEHIETFSGNCSFVFLTLIFYFAALDSEFPTESKLRKGLSKLKEALSNPGALPQPA